MSLIPSIKNKESLFLLAVLLSDDYNAAAESSQAPLSLNGFRSFLLQDKSRNLENCICFLEWLVDYTARFERLPADLQQRSPAVHGDRMEMSMMELALTGSRFGLSPPGKQPFRSAADFCQLRYLGDKAPMNLCMPVSIREQCLAALGRTTHPSVFTGVADHCRRRLAEEALPSYVAASCRNITPHSARWYYAGYGTLVALALLFTPVTIALTWSPWTRLGMLPVLLAGLFGMLAARCSLSILNHLRGVRDLDCCTAEDTSGALEVASPVTPVAVLKPLTIDIGQHLNLSTVHETDSEAENAASTVKLSEYKSRPVSAPMLMEVSLSSASVDQAPATELPPPPLTPPPPPPPPAFPLPTDDLTQQHSAASIACTVPITISLSGRRKAGKQRRDWLSWLRRHRVADVEAAGKYGQEMQRSSSPTRDPATIVRSSVLRKLQRRQLLCFVLPISILLTALLSTALMFIPATLPSNVRI